ncbi:acetate kinase [Propionicimonas sp.]|uniref:acetate kinase n=1 Tax=Propionicimonas sp. TaxID=1955623 RepID=UPI0018036BFA|nr:acetate kinase [Propionicimonas sp.]MBU3975886.1 acetate kinase [Actinomycetota bacterium]MBA3019715.1 acetate kinase [Propionicimonas sp.]MBU4006472.1 acetate kinase [Actinomycetota bacterium]MBU4066640.1 acetate kinase [Actinomycetota bacterium]MBU4094595.1 acetate kinase [Actinomycetota bacterium]
MTTPILLLNCGSSSIKYQVIDADSEEVVASGIIQRIGDGESTISHTFGGQTLQDEHGFADHGHALAFLVKLFDEVGPKLSDIVAVGHRTVHGGRGFRSTTVIDDVVLDKLRELSPLAPLHNPPGIAGIEAAQKALPHVPHVAIFDTSFFSSMPAEAYTYAIPKEMREVHGMRKYAFHGTSHNYVSHKVAEVLGRDYDSFNQIVCHLGNGASISAIRNGVAIDASMGLTPLAGLVMGTRSGDVDPGLHLFMSQRLGLTLQEVDSLLNKKSGIFGMSGVTDFRDLFELIDEGDEDAKLAFDVYIYRLLSYIGSYVAVLGGVDALTFTAGVGENAAQVRAAVLERLEPLGFWMDAEANAIRSRDPRIISREGSPVTILVVPTNEELAMARETKAAISK